ncbi:MAG: PGF-pre-PGF domain-containing protein, partial [Methanosarcinaceae archaeon]|nr:PGF-pre-PGF domain-containing protein [Methanosarcinaceae archaeon]
MVVGIGKILTFNRKCTIFVGLLFAVIFFTLIMVPSQANEDGYTGGVSSQITIDTVNRNDIINSHSDAYYENVNVNQFLALKGKPINQISATDIHITQNLDNKQLMLGQFWDDYYINQTIPIIAMYFDEYNETPIVGTNISFQITDSNTLDLYQILYADIDSNGFASVDFIPQEAAFYEIKASVVGETGNLAYGHLLVEPFVHSYKWYIFPQNTIQTVKYTLLDKDLNPIDNLVNFNFGSVNENISPVNGTIEYSINSSTFSQDIELNNSFSGGVDPLDYIIDITNRDVLATPGTNIPYFMRVYEIDNTPVPNTYFTIYVEWRDEYWNLIDTTIFNVTTNDYGLSEFEITVPSGFFTGELYITEQSEFNNGPCWGNNYCTYGYIDNSIFYGAIDGFNFDLDVSDQEPNYNEQITITIQLHNSSIYYSNIPVYLYVDGNSEKLITNSTGKANFTFTPQPTFGTHMIFATADIPDEGGLWFRNSGFFVSPADPYIDLSLNGNIVDINVNMMDQSQNLIPNSPAVLEFVRTTTMYWQYISDDILSKYIQPASGTYSDQITLNKYGRYEGHVGWGYHDWYDTVIYTPFEYSTDLDGNFTSGQENQIYINVKKNGTPLTSGNVYLKGYSFEEECDFHDFAPVDLNGNATLTFSPQAYIEGAYITIGVSTENETYDLLVDKWIELEEPPEPPYVVITSPEDLATNVEIDTNITATFSVPMNSSTLNNNTVKVYIQDKIAGETFEDTVGTWNSANFQGFIYTEQLMVWSLIIDDSHRTIGEDNITYSTQPLLKDYQIYANEGIEVQGSGNYSVMGWLGDERVVIEKWVVSDLVFEQNSIDIKTLHSGETWDLGDGYSLKLLGLDVNGNEAWLALNNYSGEIDNQVCVNQTACIFTTDTDPADDVTLLVTYLKKVNTTHIELKYTWLISQDIIEISAGSGPDIFDTFMSYGTIYLRSDEDVLLTRGTTTPLFDDFKFEVEDTTNVTYRLIRQTEIAVEGDISYDNASRTITFDPVFDLMYDTNYISYITTGAEDLAGNDLVEDYEWEFKTMHYTPSGNGGSSGGGGGGGGFVSNLILNPGFEYLTQGQPDNWTLSGTASVTDTLSSEGNNSLNINASISGDILFANQTLDIYHVAGKSYTFTFDIARSGGISGDAISFYLNYIDFNATKQSLYVWTPNPDGDNNFWIYYHEQIIPSDAFNITGFEMHTNGTGEYWIDNLSIEIEQTPPFLDLYQNYTIEVLEIDIDGSEIWLEINKNGNPVKDIVIQNLSTYEYRNVTTNDLIINCTVSYVQFLNDNRSWVVLLEDIWQFSDVDGSVLINGTYNTFFGGEQYHDASMLPSGSAVLDIYESTGDVFSFDIGEVENDFIMVEGDGALKFDQTLNISGNLVDMGVVTIDTVTAAPDEGYVNGSVLPVLGHTYCVNISGKYAKFEVVDVTTKNIRIRWSYQPDGTKNFIHTALSLPETDDGDTSSSGGGGSGGSSGEDYYNIVLSETDRQSVFKNSHISYRFDLEDNIVSHINFRALKSAGTIAAKVEILKNTSTLVSTLPPNKVYKNLNIWVGNAGWGTERNIADATVVFTV